MPIDNPLDDGKANSYAWEFRTGMQALEGTKEFIHIRHIETSAIITDIVYSSLIWVLYGAEFDVSKLLFGRKFPGIVDQVLKHDLHQARIAVYNQVGSNGNIHNSIGFCLLKFANDVLRCAAQVGCLWRQCCARDT